MCGIVGIVDRSGQSVSELRRAIQRMSHAVAHRGPDDWGVIGINAGRLDQWSKSVPEGDRAHTLGPPANGQTVLLGHRRLAVIDLSPAAHQPMGTADGRLWVAFNGEIYNYRSLRADLESQGVVFRSASDTEVLLALYAREGPRCLDRLRGMFAFVMWDREKHELFLARDRLGMKPLYYAQTSDGLFVFASELKAILASGYFPDATDEAGEGAFLRTGSIPAPRTFYSGLNALQPGHWARWDGSELTTQAYWSLEETLSGSPGGAVRTAEAAACVRQALLDSARAHMVSDVPVGLFLSGGLDSTAVLGAVRQFYQGPLKTFTIVFPGTEWDEGKRARQVAAYYGTTHTELEVTREDFDKGLDEFFVAMDQPTVDGFNTFWVAKLARRAGAKVVLSGLGGDEILGGYQSFVSLPRIARCLRPLRYAPWLSDIAASVVGKLPAQAAPKAAQMVRDGHADMERLWRAYRALFTDRQVDAVGRRNGAGTPALRPARPTPEGSFWTIAAMEVGHFMIPQLLRDADVFSMCHGLELRTPFADHRLVQAVHDAGTWPRGGARSYKIALFRELSDLLPPGYREHRKMGFTFPCDAWLRQDLASNGRPHPALGVRAMLGRPQYRPFVESFLRGRLHWSRIWGLYVLERFKTSSKAGVVTGEASFCGPASHAGLQGRVA